MLMFVIPQITWWISGGGYFFCCETVWEPDDSKSGSSFQSGETVNVNGGDEVGWDEALMGRQNAGSWHRGWGELG